MKQHILFVINPLAGTISKAMLPELIRERSEVLGFDYTIYETTGNNDEEKIREVAAQLLPSIIASIGGDGTLNLVVRVAKYTPARVGIIPGGSANGMARELNIPADFTEAINLLVKGKTKTIDTVLVNDKYVSVHLSDVGLNAKIIRRFEQEKRRGMWGYARQLWRELLYVRKYHFQIEMSFQQGRLEVRE